MSSALNAITYRKQCRFDAFTKVEIDRFQVNFPDLNLGKIENIVGS